VNILALRHFLLMTCVLASLGVQASTTIYFHNDLAGSPVAATNAGGQVQWRESYRPYGERLTKHPASASNDLWFTSRREDAETGLVYMGARYYDPGIGRFVSTDPKGFDDKDLHTFNRYGYAANNPYKYFDPDGRRFVFVTGSSEQFKSNVAAMRQYLDAKGAGAVVAAVDERPETIYLQQGSPGVFEYAFETKIITFDAFAGNLVSPGKIQSPALGFLHEASHALQDLTNNRQFESDRTRPDAKFGDKEERRVIEKVENPAAIKLGEPTRSNHRYTYVGVKCPTCTE
jgi:RHS repeat-associated protein